MLAPELIGTEFDPTLPAPPKDVVEALLFFHSRTRQALTIARSIANGASTCSTAEAAGSVVRFLTDALPRHLADEEESIAPRLKGRHLVVDKALERSVADHFRERALAARLTGLLGRVAREVESLTAVQHELRLVTDELGVLLDTHLALEESILFPALRRLLRRDALEQIGVEMTSRHAA